MILLATSTEVVALIAAGAALLGGVLGAVAGGMSDYVLERRTETTRARAGARLLRSDLRRCADRLAVAVSWREWRRFWELPTESWDAFRDVLAASVDAAAWNDVECAVREIRRQDANFTKAREENHSVFDEELEPEMVETMERMIDASRRAFNALAPLAKGLVADTSFGAPPDETR